MSRSASPWASFNFSSGRASSQYQGSIESVTPTGDHPLDVQPVLRTGKDLEDDEIFGAAGTQRPAGAVHELRRTLHGALLERERTEGDVDRHAVTGAQQDDAVGQGEGGPCPGSGQGMLEERGDVRLLRAITRDPAAAARHCSTTCSSGVLRA